MTVIMNAAKAVGKIRDGDSILFGGFLADGVTLEEIRQKTGAPVIPDKAICEMRLQ